MFLWLVVMQGLPYYLSCHRLDILISETIFLFSVHVDQKSLVSRFWSFHLLGYYYFLQVKPACTFTADERNYLTHRIQNGGTEVVEVINFAFSEFLNIVS